MPRGTCRSSSQLVMGLQMKPVMMPMSSSSTACPTTARPRTASRNRTMAPTIAQTTVARRRHFS